MSSASPNPPPGFVVFALPRSRTAWLSKFLTYGGWTCGHDEIRHLRSPEDIKSWFSQPFTGSAETAGAYWWRALPEGTRVVVVRRPVEQVVESYARMNMGFDLEKLKQTMLRLDSKLDQVTTRVPNLVSATFDDLNDEECCQVIFEHCLTGFVHDSAWYHHMQRINIQIDMRALLRYLIAHQTQLLKLAQIMKFQLLENLRRAARPVEFSAADADGVVFAQEDFVSFMPDAKDLLCAHQVRIGAAPADWTKKNLELLTYLFSVGMVRITTARLNGKLFGYLIAVISPDLNDPNAHSSLHTAFYASPDIPGLGLKLQRASQQELTASGVKELYLRAGADGESKRLSVLYRRMGAKRFGELYKLELN